MLTHEERERIDVLIDSIEGYAFETTKQGGRKPIEEQAEKAWEAWNEIWGFMEREENFTGSLGVTHDWVLLNAADALEDLLHNSGQYERLIALCLQKLKITWDEEIDSVRQNIYENAKRTIADSYFDMGDTDRALALYKGYLEQDPMWGWCLIGYWRILKDIEHPEYEKVLNDVFDGLQKNALYRDRDVLVEELIHEFDSIGETEKADWCRSLMKDSRSYAPYHKPEPVVNTQKIGRNDPCPCGSGKKYKKCCGK